MYIVIGSLGRNFELLGFFLSLEYVHVLVIALIDKKAGASFILDQLQLGYLPVKKLDSKLQSFGP